MLLYVRLYLRHRRTPPVLNANKQLLEEGRIFNVLYVIITHIQNVQMVDTYQESEVSKLNVDCFSHFFACNRCQKDKFPKFTATLQNYEVLQNNYKGELIKSQTKTASLTADNGTLNARILELESVTSGLNATVSSRENEITRIKEDFNKKVKDMVQITEVQRRITDYESALHALNVQLSDKTSAINEKNNASLLLQNDLTHLQETNLALENKLKDGNTRSSKRPRLDSAGESTEELDLFRNVIREENNITNEKVDLLLTKFQDFAVR